jgi:hypothetical protein
VSYDPRTGQILQFGGLDDVVPEMTDVTWQWGGYGWKDAQIVPSPAPRGYAGIAYDVVRDETVLVGGEDLAGTGFSDVWGFSGGVWTPRGAAPGKSTRAAIAYDEVAQRVTMFGGALDSVTMCSAETWSWDGSVWADVSPALSPPSRCRAAVTYDRFHEKVLLWGGAQQEPRSDRDDTWEWDGAAWVERPGTVGPSARDHASMTFDAAFRGDVLFGGGVPLESTLERDTWIWDGDIWTIPVPVEEPPACQGLTVYDAAHAQTVLLGCGTGLSSEVWTFRWQAGGEHEACLFGFDTDGDQAIGCDDLDCWGVCHPMCPPGLFCPPEYPECGDGVCSQLESCRLCPEDCGACPLLCGDYICDPGETSSSCPGDC